MAVPAPLAAQARPGGRAAVLPSVCREDSRPTRTHIPISLSFFWFFGKAFKLAIDNPSAIWYYNARLAKANLTGSRMDGASPPVLC